MAKVVVKKAAKKVKRKFPVEIKASESFNSIVLGKSEVSDLTTLPGKTIKVNLMYVTGNIKNQNVRLVFRINDVHAGVAKSEIVSYQQIPYYLNRFVKSGSDLVEDSFVAVSKDGKNVRIKPFAITKMNTSGMVLTSLRNKIQEVIIADVLTKTAEDFISGVTYGKVQTGYRNEVKKVFPLKAFEFKKIIIE
jgi:ribosomal protein S3AE